MSLLFYSKTSDDVYRIAAYLYCVFNNVSKEPTVQISPIHWNSTNYVGVQLVCFDCQPPTAKIQSENFYSTAEKNCALVVWANYSSLPPPNILQYLYGNLDTPRSEEEEKGYILQAGLREMKTWNILRGMLQKDLDSAQINLISTRGLTQVWNDYTRNVDDLISNTNITTSTAGDIAVVDVKLWAIANKYIVYAAETLRDFAIVAVAVCRKFDGCYKYLLKPKAESKSAVFDYICGKFQNNVINGDFIMFTSDSLLGEYTPAKNLPPSPNLQLPQSFIGTAAVISDYISENKSSDDPIISDNLIDMEDLQFKQNIAMSPPVIVNKVPDEDLLTRLKNANQRVKSAEEELRAAISELMQVVGEVSNLK